MRSTAIVAEKCRQMNLKIFYFLENCGTHIGRFCDNYVVFILNKSVDFIAVLNR